jgi:hypothetical protein
MERAERSGAPVPRRAGPSSDPFFDRPYEPSVTSGTPAWEQSAPSVQPGASLHLKPRKKIAALFGAKKTEASSAA